MKLFWTGTDSLMLVDYSMRKPRKRIYWWIFRWLIRIMDHFIQEHYCDSELVMDNIIRFGTRRPVTVFEDYLWHNHPYPKKEHNGFNVLYYRPKNSTDREFSDWLYGYDIFKEVNGELDNDGVDFIVVDGTYDMKKIYPIIDFYLRPNRHDGSSRMRRECEIQNIPYYWTPQNPKADEAIQVIKDVMEKKNKI